MSNSIRLYIYFITLFIMSVLIHIKNFFLEVLCLIFYIMISWFLLSWKTFNAKWVCDKCSKNIRVT